MSRRRSRAAWPLLLALSLQLAPAAPAQSDERGSDSGWHTVIGGMRHFTGLTCPDRIGMLSRVRVLTSAADRIAGCVYLATNGISVVVRSHLPGSSAATARAFDRRYSTAGFKRLAATGAAAAGLSFNTGTTGERTRCETLWRLTGRRTDYTLWMAYSLPDQGDLVGPLVADFTRQLARSAR